ncbi:uncharacterized protein BDV17DRAFT_287422 [Aspergillus undulatus]|uniref:uncharacterized protein n=1 Tax=Aspergillus undulatus TaxID=1810928 RepID=UPI003CCDD875
MHPLFKVFGPILTITTLLLPIHTQIGCDSKANHTLCPNPETRFCASGSLQGPSITSCTAGEDGKAEIRSCYESTPQAEDAVCAFNGTGYTPAGFEVDVPETILCDEHDLNENDSDIQLDSELGERGDQAVAEIHRASSVLGSTTLSSFDDDIASETLPLPTRPTAQAPVSPISAVGDVGQDRSVVGSNPWPGHGDGHRDGEHQHTKTNTQDEDEDALTLNIVLVIPTSTSTSATEVSVPVSGTGMPWVPVFGPSSSTSTPVMLTAPCTDPETSPSSAFIASVGNRTTTTGHAGPDTPAPAFSTLTLYGTPHPGPVDNGNSDTSSSRSSRNGSAAHIHGILTSDVEYLHLKTMIVTAVLSVILWGFILCGCFEE